MSKKESARALALAVLGEVLEQGAYSNIALHQALKDSSLSEKDKNLVTEIVYGTLMRKLTLEWYLSHVIEDRERLDTWVYHLLMMSLYQLLYLDKIPQHAIVHEAVELAKKGRGADRFVNAILRRLTEKPLPDINQIKRQNKRLSIQYSLPVWLVRKLIEEYGDDRAIKIFESLLVRNKASARVVYPNDLEQLKKETGAQSSLLSDVGLVRSSGHFAGTTAFKEGRLTIQDESSQLVAPTFALQGHEEVLDACAAPGGKTTHIASYLTTGKVTALDLYDHKLTLIEQNAKRLGVADKVVTKRLDAREVYETFGPDAFDCILVDAPCSGLGLLRRKPDIKYNKDLADFKSLQAIQLEILSNICQSLRKGGIITYSTCTIVGEENQQVVEAFLAQHPNFKQIFLKHTRKDILQDGHILITPELYGSDGFFISQFQRIS